MTDPQLIEALEEESAEQDVPGFRKKRKLCRELLLGGTGIYHIAHYTGGVLDFSLDLLGHPSAPVAIDGAEPAQRRETHRLVGAQLVYRAADLSRRVWELQCGGLVRLAVQTRADLVFCNTVIGGEHVVGFGSLPASTTDAVADPSRAGEIDRAAAQLATALRQLVRLPSQNPGGWQTAGDAQVPVSPSTVDFMAYVVGSPEVGGLLTTALRPAGLHYLSHHRAGEQTAAADILRHPDLEPFFSRGVTVAGRRTRYERLAGDLSLLSLQVSRDLRRTVAGQVERLVLDLEIGAVFYYLLAPEEYLFGVALDQDWVTQADLDMSAVGRQLTGSDTRTST
ncbi:hypothetical protein SAMN05443287_10458 [Micromonospora phaseoli]|uniref:Uncharacterized protein n=1 Tax=Micromonospora phaseoli TaxID=1144548 RepID=A0A1H6YHQ7_9ACTN|nr:hypothetical protein [Micromonospora phaseoli]PZW00031.1 hypothetical protein CLV64_10357 [Micromonospora phaseoli]GIJ80429.1 hypothetical protein Xph01_48610 [Micromonospora phaseoli]SEJ36305.1 hypothetical protein SAMN05443287_10458 [Micromonospora phaseoli]